MFPKEIVVIALAGPFMALALTVAAQTGNGTGASDRLVERYTGLAGSENDAKVLVANLREGTFNPRFEKMGFSNIDNVLALAEASLQRQGIAKPTPDQVSFAVSDVLWQRAEGKGWVDIARSMGLKPGDLKRVGP